MLRNQVLLPGQNTVYLKFAPVSGPPEGMEANGTKDFLRDLPISDQPLWRLPIPSAGSPALGGALNPQRPTWPMPEFWGLLLFITDLVPAYQIHRATH